MNNRLLAKTSFYFLLAAALVTAALTPVIISAFLLAAALANYFILNPVTIRERGTEGLSQIPLKDEKRDILLLLSRESLLGNAQSRTFFDNDWSAAWVNTMEKEFGACDIQYSDDFSFEALALRRILILGKNIAITDDAAASIHRFVENGGTLITEMPSESICSLLDIKSRGGIKRQPKTITRVNPDYAKEPVCEALKKLPLGTFLLEAEAADNSGWEIVLEIDSSPAVLRRRLGSGVMIAVLFDYGLQMVSLKQGRPHLGNFRLRKFFDRQMQGLKSFDLAGWHKKQVLDYPFADILEMLLRDLIVKKQPVAAWWYYPQQFENCMIASFDEDYYGERSLDVPKCSINSAKRETLFVIADSNIRKETMTALVDNGFDIGVHWNRFLFHLNNKGGHWNRHKMLAAQIRALGEKLPPSYKVQSCRIHFLRWDDDFTNTFNILQENEIRLDSSLGPGRGQMGYIFGTGFPYHPQDKNGGLFGLYEMPFQIHEPQGSCDPVFNERLFNDSLGLWHNCVVALFHSYYCLEGKTSYANYKGLCECANRSRTWAPNFSEFLSFWEARNRSRIKSIYDGRQLTAEVFSETEGLSLRVPASNEIESIDVDGSSTGPAAIIGADALVAVKKGAHKVTITYKSGKKEDSYGKDISYTARV